MKFKSVFNGEFETENYKLLREIKNVEEVDYSKNKINKINIRVYTAICPVSKNEVRNILKQSIK